MPVRPVLLTLALTAGTVLAGVALPAASAASAEQAGSYIVTTEGLAAPVAELARGLGGEIGFIYTDAMQGFSVSLPVAAVDELAALPGVSAVEADSVMRATETQTPTPSYGLDRVDQRALPLNNTFTTSSDANGVRAYIIDTGILLSHTDFGGRAVTGFDAVTVGGSAIDCNGHGTHVAGTTGGSQYGVAKAVTLIAVRVLGCEGSGSNAGVIAGVDFVARDHAAGSPAVANMSLGGGTSTALDNAVKGAIADGVVFAVAAGNGGGVLGEVSGDADACNGSPARVPEALTVGATDETDTMASYSSRGTCLDLFAPGTEITSDWYSSSTATNTISGTSMSSPHVAGAAALLLEVDPAATATQISTQLVANATPNVVNSPGLGSPNRLLFTR